LLILFFFLLVFFPVLNERFPSQHYRAKLFSNLRGLFFPFFDMIDFGFFSVAVIPLRESFRTVSAFRTSVFFAPPPMTPSFCIFFGFSLATPPIIADLGLAASRPPRGFCERTPLTTWKKDTIVLVSLLPPFRPTWQSRKSTNSLFFFFDWSFPLKALLTSRSLRRYPCTFVGESSDFRCSSSPPIEFSIYNFFFCNRCPLSGGP